MYATAAQPGDNFLVFNTDLEYVIKPHPGINQCLRLGNRARKTVEQETIGTVILGYAFLDEGNNDVVGNEAT